MNKFNFNAVKKKELFYGAKNYLSENVCIKSGAGVI